MLKSHGERKIDFVPHLVQGRAIEKKPRSQEERGRVGASRSIGAKAPMIALFAEITPAPPKADE